MNLTNQSVKGREWQGGGEGRLRDGLFGVGKIWACLSTDDKEVLGHKGWIYTVCKKEKG